MTFEQLVAANRTIQTVDVKGKQYAEVNQRIKAFRLLFPNGSITTDILSLDNGVCVMKAFVSDENGNVLATGTAYEKESSSFINKTSYIENCETSAVGRALGMLGIGIDVSIASYEEVANAIHNQDITKASESSNVVNGIAMITQKQVGYIKDLCMKNKSRCPLVTGYLERTGAKELAELDMTQANDLINSLVSIADTTSKGLSL